MRALLLAPHDDTDATIYGLAGDDGVIRYIGRTVKPLEERLQRHRWQSRAHGGTCQRRVSVWFREQTNVTIVPLEVVPRTQAPRAEWEWIQKMRDGVRLLNRLGYDWSPSLEQRATIVATNRRRFEDSAARARIARISRDRVYTEEERKRMSERRKGIKHTDEAKAKMSAARRGIPKSAETRARMSEAQRKRASLGNYQPLSEDHKAKISTSSKGRPKSEEWKKKMMESRRRRREVV